jgi:putative transposase
MTISIKHLCHIANVSVSGYYKWISNVENRTERLKKEIADYEIIYEIFINHDETAGFRTITMELKHQYSIIMNHKKVIRIMEKYGLKCKVRRERTYGNTFDKNRIEHTYPNLTNAKFDCVKPYSVLHTDITYIKFAYGGKTAYLSAIKDQTTREILAYKISNSLEVSFVIETIKDLQAYSLAGNVIIHSDQGVHYSSKKYNEIISKMGLNASMSRRGKCVDNAPIESFFGHMKDEVDFNILQTLEEIVEIIDKYIYYYNNYRPQWTLKKMTPIEYRNHILSVA